MSPKNRSSKPVRSGISCGKYATHNLRNWRKNQARLPTTMKPPGMETATTTNPVEMRCCWLLLQRRRSPLYLELPPPLTATLAIFIPGIRSLESISRSEEHTSELQSRGHVV